MKFVLGLLFAALLTTAAYSSTLKDAYDATYKLYANGQAECSGTFIRSDANADILLTAAHCIKPDPGTGYTLIVADYDELADTISYVTILLLDKVDANVDNDVALFSVRNPELRDFPTVDVAPLGYTPKVGEHFYSFGYPHGRTITIREGLYLKEGRDQVVPPLKGVFYVSTIYTTAGMSGGGVYTQIGDEFYLIGTNYAGEGLGETMFSSYSSTLPSVRDIVNKMWHVFTYRVSPPKPTFSER